MRSRKSAAFDGILVDFLKYVEVLIEPFNVSLNNGTVSKDWGSGRVRIDSGESKLVNQDGYH